MASSSAPASVFDNHRFRAEFNQTLFESIIRRKKVTPEVGFNLDEDEYPQIKEQIALRGWRRLAAPITEISELLVQEFYANTAVSDEEMEHVGQLPYKSYVRGVEVDFSPKNIRRVMRFKEETPGVEMDYTTHQATNQWLDEVLAELCVPGATWKLSSSQPAVSIQLRRAELFPLTRGWQEFIIHSLVPTGNKSEITVARAILIHAIMKGEEVRVEDIIADNMAVIAQGLHGKGKLCFSSTIYKLCKDAKVPLREFKRTTRIPQEKPIMAKRIESTRLPRNVPHQQQDKDDEDQPMPQAEGGNEEDQNQQQYHQFQQPPQQHYPKFQQNFENQYHQDLQGIEEHLSSMQFFQQSFYENMQKSQGDYMEEVKAIKAKQEELWNNTNRFHSQIRKEQDMLGREIQEIRKNQINQTLMSSQKANAKKKLEQVVERQARELAEMKKQLNQWTRNASAREQANPNLSEIPINHIPDLMQTNAEKGRPMFYGALKSHVGTSASSQSAQQEPIPLRTAPPLPGYQPLHGPTSASSQSAQQEPIPLRTAPPLPGYQPPHGPPN
ncbi:hypothetical protein PIB30_056437 [Stylosanthes scabra]|uniref:Putative plant transposon protein domain-containing protein n=1 Tax=Stylosanthes scabra TaxID=79078 RepID=A0ABU6ULR0_9FABA|nr:hypothetical protein [Stylosanthes scabra]